MIGEWGLNNTRQLAYVDYINLKVDKFMNMFPRYNYYCFCYLILNEIVNIK